ncbi:MAG: hypothetical protein ACM3JJ_12570 [Hyphomicrobiales bacterium]
MKRPLVAAAVGLLVVLGIVDPYACVQYSSGGSLLRPLPKKARARLEHVAAAALALVPAPPPPYARQLDVSGDPVADEKAPWDDGADRWLAPGVARAASIWIWSRDGDGDAETDAPPDLEIRVYVNGETGPPRSLESVGDAPRLLDLEGATAVEVTTIGADEADRGASGADTSDGRDAGGGRGSGVAGDGGPPAARVTLPMTAAEAAHAVTVIRVVIGDDLTERAFEARAEGRRPLPDVRKPARNADRVESITVELFGGKHDVESLAAEIPVASLRALLDR